MITFTNNGINTSILDYHARQFITTTKITDETQIRAINELCKDLKREGFWDKLQIIYPFVYNPGFTNSVLYELKTGSYNLAKDNISAGASTFSNTGVKFNKGQRLTSVSINELKRGNFGNVAEPLIPGRGYPYAPPGHISIYNRFNSYAVSDPSYSPINASYNSVGTSPGSGMIAYSFGTNSVRFSFLQPNPFNSTEASQAQIPFFGNSQVSWSHYTASNNTSGFWIYSSVDDAYGYSASVTYPHTYLLSQNGQSLSSYKINLQYTANFPTISLGGFLGGAGTWGDLSEDEICWVSVGWSDGRGTTASPFTGLKVIDPTKHFSFYQIVQKFQTTLGRQV